MEISIERLFNAFKGIFYPKTHPQAILIVNKFIFFSRTIPLMEMCVYVASICYHIRKGTHVCAICNKQLCLCTTDLLHFINRDGVYSTCGGLLLQLM